MKIFIDVDNTILEHYGFYSPETESRIHKSIGKFPVENSPAIDAMYSTSVCRDPESVRKLFFLDNAYILTKYSIMEYEVHKRKRVAEVLGITVDELNNLKDPDGNPKYIGLKLNESKVDVVKDIFKVDSICDFVLIDDYSANIIEWEKHGGIGVKYFNEYNSPNHPTNGISISNFSIFKNCIEDSNLFITGVNKLKLNHVSHQLATYDKGHKEVDFTNIIIEDIKERFNIDYIEDNNKVNFMDFMLQYYHFIEINSPGYWKEKVEAVVTPGEVHVVKSIFEGNNERITQGLTNSGASVLTINILTSGVSRPSQVYDVYLTIDEKKLIASIDGVFVKMVEVFNKLFISFGKECRNS